MSGNKLCHLIGAALGCSSLLCELYGGVCVAARQMAVSLAIIYFRTIEGHFLFIAPTAIVLESFLEEALGCLKVTSV